MPTFYNYASTLPVGGKKATFLLLRGHQNSNQNLFSHGTLIFGGYLSGPREALRKILYPSFGTPWTQGLAARKIFPCRSPNPTTPTPCQGHICQCNVVESSFRKLEAYRTLPRMSSR
jgi:hypothetical protein